MKFLLQSVFYGFSLLFLTGCWIAPTPRKLLLTRDAFQSLSEDYAKTCKQGEVKHLFIFNGKIRTQGKNYDFKGVLDWTHPLKYHLKINAVFLGMPVAHLHRTEQGIELALHYPEKKFYQADTETLLLAQLGIDAFPDNFQLIPALLGLLPDQMSKNPIPLLHYAQDCFYGFDQSFGAHTLQIRYDEAIRKPILPEQSVRLLPLHLTVKVFNTALADPLFDMMLTLRQVSSPDPSFKQLESAFLQAT